MGFEWHEGNREIVIFLRLCNYLLYCISTNMFFFNASVIILTVRTYELCERFIFEKTKYTLWLNVAVIEINLHPPDCFVCQLI